MENYQYKLSEDGKSVTIKLPVLEARFAFECYAEDNFADAGKCREETVDLRTEYRNKAILYFELGERIYAQSLIKANQNEV